MSLKNDYYLGQTGLLAQMDAAFDAGVAYVGSANVQIVNLDFGDVNGAALAVGEQFVFTVTSANASAGAVYSNNTQTFTVNTTIVAGTTLSTQGSGPPTASGTLTLVSGSGDATITFSAFTNPAAPGLYFSVSSPSTQYIVWFQVDAETVPSLPSGATSVQVNVLETDTPIMVASKAAAAINLIANQPISAVSAENVIVLTNVVIGPGVAAPSVGTLGGTAYIDLVQAGTASSGNYASLQQALTANAAAGLTHFTVTLPVSYQPQYLRGSRGRHFPGAQNQFTPDPNYYSVAASNQNYGNDPSDNLIRKSFFAGIHQGLANNNIYDFECNLKLNTYDQLNTAVDFNFTFQTK